MVISPLETKDSLDEDNFTDKATKSTESKDKDATVKVSEFKTAQ